MHEEAKFAVTLPEKNSMKALTFNFTMYSGRSTVELKAEAQFKGEDRRGHKSSLLSITVNAFFRLWKFIWLVSHAECFSVCQHMV